MKTLTIRLPEAAFDALAARAEAAKTTLADTIRAALTADLEGASNAEIMREIKALRADLAAVE